MAWSQLQPCLCCHWGCMGLCGGFTWHFPEGQHHGGKSARFLTIHTSSSAENIWGCNFLLEYLEYRFHKSTEPSEWTVCRWGWWCLLFFTERFVSISLVEQPFFLHRMTLFLCQESVFVGAIYCWDLCFVLSMHCLFENYSTLLTIVTSNKTPCEGKVLALQSLLYKFFFFIFLSLFAVPPAF